MFMEQMDETLARRSWIILDMCQDSILFVKCVNLVIHLTNISRTRHCVRYLGYKDLSIHSVNT